MGAGSGESWKCKREIICFHNPDEKYGWLSNWYLSDFEVDDVSFSSMEQYMMYEKAVVFEDFNMAGKILGTQNVGTIKQHGRQVANYNDIIWNGQNLLGFAIMQVRTTINVMC